MTSAQKIELQDMLFEYACNAINSDKIASFLNLDNNGEIKSILGEFQNEMDACKCDPEGLTGEQEAKADAICADYAEQLLELK